MTTFTHLVEILNANPTSEDREIQPRDYLYASELGKSDIDVWLSMHAIKYSNPPGVRARGKFSAGNQWEGVVQNVFRRMGLLVEQTVDEKRVRGTGKGLLDISGKIDVLLNGTKTIEELKQIKATAQQKLLGLIYDNPMLESEFRETIRMCNAFIEIKKPIIFSNQLVEVKSSSLMGFNGVEESDEPHSSHALQAGFYAHYNKKWSKKYSLVLYVSKDDTRYHICSVSGAKNSKWQKKLMESWKSKSEAYLKNTPPEMEPLIVVENGKFKLNFNVMYSNYLSLIYGFEHQEEYRKDYSGKISSWNRVLKRMANNEKMTKSNEEYIKEMKQLGYNPDKMANQLHKILNKTSK